MEAIAGRERAIELLQKAYDAFNRGDMAGAVAGLDPQIEWTEPDSFPGGGTHHGTAEVQGYLTRSRAGWAEGRSEPERFIAAGDRIVVFVHARFRGKGSAEWGEVRLADVYTFRDGRPVQMRAFADREEALTRLRRALDDTVLSGIETNLDYLRQLVADPIFVSGGMTTRALDAFGYAPRTVEVLEAAILSMNGRGRPVELK